MYCVDWYIRFVRFEMKGVNMMEENQTEFSKVTTDEAKPIVQNDEKKVKPKWYENLIVYYVVTVALLYVGTFAGLLVTQIPVLIYYQMKAKQAGIDLDVNIQIPSTVTVGLNYVIFIGIWIVTLLWLLKKNNRFIMKTVGKGQKNNTILWLFAGLAIGFVTNGICILAAYLHHDISLTFDSFSLVPLVVIFICVFIQSSAEELICRGYLYQKLMKRYNKPVLAIVANSLLFALLHLGNEGVTVLSVINIFLVGIAFSLMVYYLDSIWCAMAAHAAWNFTQNIIFGLPNSGMEALYSVFKLDMTTARDSFAYDVGFGVEGTIVAALVQVATCVVIVLYGIHKKKKSQQNADICEA